jgi:amino acid transporter
VKISLLIALGLYGAVHSGGQSAVVALSDVAAPGIKNWFEVLLLLSFMYGGFETALMPLGEVENPRRVVPFALGIGLALCIAIYSLIQVAVLNTPGAGGSARPLAVVASTLFGPWGAVLTNIGALVCIYGYLSASVLGSPRLAYALADKGDFPPFLARLHPRFGTPHLSVVLFGLCTWAIAVTGSFRAALALSVGARLVTYGTTCAALMPLRHFHPERLGFTIPFGPIFSVLGVAMTLVLVTRVHQREAIALAATGILASLNWWWISRRQPEEGEIQSTVTRT